LPIYGAKCRRAVRGASSDAEHGRCVRARSTNFHRDHTRALIHCREWYAASYAEVKHLNPRFPFMIRPNPEGEPFMFVEYGA